MIAPPAGTLEGHRLPPGHRRITDLEESGGVALRPIEMNDYLRKEVYGAAFKDV